MIDAINTHKTGRARPNQLRPIGSQTKSAGPQQVAKPEINDVPLAGGATLLLQPKRRPQQMLEFPAKAAGASLAEIALFFGWQPHSARAALSGLRRAGPQVTSFKTEDGTTNYCLHQYPPPQTDRAVAKL